MIHLIRSSFNFIYNNLFGIVVVLCIFTAITMFLVVNNIKLKKQKVGKASKVIVIEKLTDKHSSAALKQQAEESVGPKCKKLETKDGCTSLGGCVWVTATDNSSKISKCVEAAGVGNKMVAGSNGPSAACFRSKTGKFIPWEKYYYLDGSDIKEKDGYKGTCSN